MKGLSVLLVSSCLLALLPSSWTMQGAPPSPPSSPPVVDLGDLESEADSEPEVVAEQDTGLGLMGGLALEVDGSPAEKRAYTYVSEYKRLPIYNFGLGKRWGDALIPSDDKRARLYSFGLGKRTRPYSFGLGKRAGDVRLDQRLPSYFQLQPYRPNLFPQPSNQELVDAAEYDALSTMLQDNNAEKRSSRLYSFGLGKRAPRNEDFVQRFNFGIGKRSAPLNGDLGRQFQFGLGKMRLPGFEEHRRAEDEVSAS